MSRWRRLPTGARVGIAAVAALVLVNVGLGLLDAATRGADRSGSRSSSFSTAATGTAAYSELLERYGHTTRQIPGKLTLGDLDPAATVVVLDADAPTGSERRNVSAFIRSGGRFVSGGANAEEWTSAFRFTRVSWEPGGPAVTRAHVDGDPYTVHTDGDGRWSTPTGSSLTVQKPDPGTVILLADPSPLQNRRLDEAQNAAFGLALAGEKTRPVLFVEGPHGFDSASGFDAIPGRWKVALVGGALAALLTLIAASRRVGPPEEEVRKLAPPRRAYVDALGASLARTRRPAQAIAPIQRAAREHLTRRAGLPGDAEPDLIRACAAREGWSAEEIDALFAPATDNDSILAAGRALARAERGAS
ncbi:MAG: DUF4350 domain-containing protein [Acidimicrobiia bacterium]